MRHRFRTDPDMPHQTKLKRTFTLCFAFGLALRLAFALDAVCVLGLAWALGFACARGQYCALGVAGAPGIGFDLKPGRQRLSGQRGPAAVELHAHLPHGAGSTVEIAVMVVTVGMSDDCIDSAPRVENQLHAADLLAAISVCRGVRGRPVSDFSARWMIDTRGRA